MNRFGKVLAVLFDMDGTLYQDFTFHRDYLRYLLAGSVYEQLTEPVIKIVDDILDRDVLPMNRFYRVRDVGAVRNGEELLLQLRANMVEEMPFARCYREGLGNLQYLGDPWEVATYVAASLGVLPTNGEEAFLRVRKEMAQRALAPNPKLLEVLRQLRERYVTVLLSNSPEESASNFIDRLGFTGAFTFVLYGAGKPNRLFENLRCCPQLEGIGVERLLSVGDHAFNEIVNVHLAGGRTLWMNPYAPAPQVPCTYSVKTIPELTAFLRGELLE